MSACPLTTTSVAPAPVAPRRPAAQPVSYLAHSLPPTPSPLPIEDLIALSDVVARVCITSVSESVSVEESEHAGTWDWWLPGGVLTANRYSRYVGVAEFRFEALEWLKGGDGGNIAVGLTVVSAERTEEETRASGNRYFDLRDKRWDNREAIVFMSNSHKGIPSSQESGRYFLGFRENYALDVYRTWLPLAYCSQAHGASCEPEFLLEDPWTLVVPGDAAAPSEVETLALSKLKSLIALPAAELQKRAFSLNGLWGWGSWAEYSSFRPPETSLIRFWAVSYLDEGVHLYWAVSDANPAVIGYRVLRRARYEPEFTELEDMPIATTATTATTDSYNEYGYVMYEDKLDIQPHTEYIYILRAYGADGDIADTRVSITTIPALEPLDGENAIPPSLVDELKYAFSQRGWTQPDSHAPPETNIENLTATTRFGEGIRLHWSTSGANPDVIRYRIMRRARYQREYAEIANVPASADGYYEDTQDIRPHTQYFYILQAYGEDAPVAAEDDYRNTRDIGLPVPQYIYILQTYGEDSDIAAVDGSIAAASITITTVPYLYPPDDATVTPAPK